MTPEGEPTVVCTGTGCELDRQVRPAFLGSQRRLGAPASGRHRGPTGRENHSVPPT